MARKLQHSGFMTTSMPYASDRMVREARVQMRRMRRRANRVQAVVRTAVLAAALASLAMGLTGALKGGSDEVASRLASATHTVAR